VAVPSEHGGWGLTLEPVLLGLIVAPSAAGCALGLAAFTAFVVRTPLKLVAVDVRRRRWLERTALAARIATAELAVLAFAAAWAVATAGRAWLWPLAVAAPLVAAEAAYDVRSHGRRLVPELCGSAGIAAVAAAIVVADGGRSTLAAGLWLVLAARAVGAIPFVRVQIVRLRRGSGPVWQSDVAQAVALALGASAVAIDREVVAGAAALVVLAVLQSAWVRRAPMPPKRLGMRQLALGIALVLVTGLGVVL
jgi:hypothetical protein